jgi:LPXTG-site transpeptidase (sortase) family protein
VASADHTGNPSTGELAPAAGVPTTAAAAPRPVELSVPDLGIEASPVVPVGVDSGGELEVPAASDVGWYRFGSPPGEPGSSVLAAHIAYDGVDGVFRHLAAVEIGAAVEVGLEDGTTVTYRIVGLADYEKAELPLDDVFDESGPDRLVLITCGGDFNPELRSYRSNVVAYAEPG